jgi:hypothetical protein
METDIRNLLSMSVDALSEYRPQTVAQAIAVRIVQSAIAGDDDALRVIVSILKDGSKAKGPIRILGGGSERG